MSGPGAMSCLFPSPSPARLADNSVCRRDRSQTYSRPRPKIHPASSTRTLPSTEGLDWAQTATQTPRCPSPVAERKKNCSPLQHSGSDHFALQSAPFHQSTKHYRSSFHTDKLLAALYPSAYASVHSRATPRTASTPPSPQRHTAALASPTPP